MPPSNRKKTPETRRIERLLGEEFPQAEAYRYNSASIRIRIVDPSFDGQARAEREARVLPLIRKLPQETQDDLMILLMLTPDEQEQSLMNMEFERPSPSLL